MRKKKRQLHAYFELFALKREALCLAALFKISKLIPQFFFSRYVNVLSLGVAKGPRKELIYNLLELCFNDGNYLSLASLITNTGIPVEANKFVLGACIASNNKNIERYLDTVICSSKSSLFECFHNLSALNWISFDEIENHQQRIASLEQRLIKESQTGNISQENHASGQKSEVIQDEFLHLTQDEAFNATKAEYFFKNKNFDKLVADVALFEYSPYYFCASLIYLQRIDEFLARIQEKIKSVEFAKIVLFVRDSIDKFRISDDDCDRVFEQLSDLSMHNGYQEDVKLIDCLIQLRRKNFKRAKHIANVVLQDKPYCAVASNYLLVAHLGSDNANEFDACVVERIKYYHKAFKVNGFLPKKLNVIRPKYWSFVRQLSTLVSKNRLNAYFTIDQQLRFKQVAIDSDNLFYFYLLTESPLKALEHIENLSKVGVEKITQVRRILNPKLLVDKKIHFFPIRHINFQYLLANSFSSYSAGDIVVCDARFKEIFEVNFPSLSFCALQQPTSGIIASMDWYFNDEILELAMQCKDAKPMQAYPLKSGTNKGWLKPVSSKQFSCLSERSLNIGISTGTGDRSGHRMLYELEASQLKSLFNGYNVNLVNLDYHVSSEHLKSIGAIQPDIDLKNDITGLLSLISQLDFLVLIPNNLLDAAAALGKKAFVFDPAGLCTYWLEDGSNQYIYSSKISFLFGRNVPETYQNLKHEISIELGAK